MQCYLSILFVCLFVFSCDVNGKPFPQIAEPSSEVDIAIFSEIETIKKETPKKVGIDNNIRKGAKQGEDDDDSDASSATNTDNAGNTGTAEATATATQNPVALPVQILVNSIIVPATQVVGSSIIRAVVSPFEFLGKQVDQFVNPSTTTKKPPKTKAPVVTQEPPKKLEGQITYFVISPDEPAPQKAAPAPVAIRRRPAPVVATRATSAPVTTEDDEEDEAED